MLKYVLWQSCASVFVNICNCFAINFSPLTLTESYWLMLLFWWQAIYRFLLKISNLFKTGHCIMTNSPEKERRLTNYTLDKIANLCNFLNTAQYKLRIFYSCYVNKQIFYQRWLNKKLFSFPMEVHISICP